jgi:hypothetical protein
VTEVVVMEVAVMEVIVMEVAVMEVAVLCGSHWKHEASHTPPRGCAGESCWVMEGRHPVDVAE